MLSDGFYEVPAGKVAAVVTHLEMTKRPRLGTMPSVNVRLVEHARPDPDWYRDVFNRVGGQDWLWFSRLGMTDDELSAVLLDPKVRVFSAQDETGDQGLLELDFREPDHCQLAYFGLARPLLGQGVGRWLMHHAIRIAWGQRISRFAVHTCTLDSPQALPFYMRSGFIPYKREVEIADDPRLVGQLPKSAAPQVPII